MTREQCLIKIARTFVKELGDPDGDPRLLRGIVELGHSLGLPVVAEGIEEPVQRDELSALACPFGQGFLFSRPLEVSAFRELLTLRTRWSAPADTRRARRAGGADPRASPASSR